MPSMDHHHLRCTHKETEPRRFQISMFTFPEGSPGWIQTQAVWWENLCPSPLSRRLFWLQKTSAVGHRRGQTGCNYVMGFLKSQTKELNLKLLTLGSHHQFLRESVLWDWSGGKTSIVLCNSTNSYVESLFSFLIDFCNGAAQTRLMRTNCAHLFPLHSETSCSHVGGLKSAKRAS